MQPKYNIQTIEDARQFVKDCAATLGSGFHPDTDFEDYFNPATDTHFFPLEQAEKYNQAMGIAFELCQVNGLDIYELTIQYVSHL